MQACAQRLMVHAQEFFKVENSKPGSPEPLTPYEKRKNPWVFGKFSLEIFNDVESSGKNVEI